MLSGAYGENETPPNGRPLELKDNKCANVAGAAQCLVTCDENHIKLTQQVTSM